MQHSANQWPWARRLRRFTCRLFGGCTRWGIGELRIEFVPLPPGTLFGTPIAHWHCSMCGREIAPPRSL